jgi:Derlin-2/3
MSDLLGIIVGHAYYFLAVLHPRATGQNYLKTPDWVYPLNCFLLLGNVVF